MADAREGSGGCSAHHGTISSVSNMLHRGAHSTAVYCTDRSYSSSRNTNYGGSICEENAAQPVESQSGSNGISLHTLQEALLSADSTVTTRDASYSEDTRRMTLYDYVPNSERVRFLFCVCTIYMPLKEDKHYKFWRNWFWIAHSLIFLGNLFLLLNAVLLSSGTYVVFIDLLNLGPIVQTCLLYPVIYALRRALYQERDVAIAKYDKAFDVALRLTWPYIQIVFVLFALCVLVLQIANFVGGYTYSFVFAILQIFCISPPILLSGGALCFLTFEEVLSMEKMSEAFRLQRDNKLSVSLYFAARDDILQREKEIPINWLLAAGLINAAIGAAMIDLLSKQAKGLGITLTLFGTFFIICFYGREVFLLFSLLLQVVKVNEYAERMISYLMDTPWVAHSSDVEDSVGEHQHCYIAAHKVALYAVMKERPIGAAVFYFRPTKLQILLQLFSLGFFLAALVFRTLLAACISI